MINHYSIIYFIIQDYILLDLYSRFFFAMPPLLKVNAFTPLGEYSRSFPNYKKEQRVNQKSDSCQLSQKNMHLVSPKKWCIFSTLAAIATMEDVRSIFFWVFYQYFIEKIRLFFDRPKNNWSFTPQQGAHAMCSSMINLTYRA